MITRNQIPTVLDHPVYGSDGKKLGEARHVFVDDATGEPEWVSVKTGMFGTHESFIPVRDATAVQDHLEVPYSKDQVSSAPHVDVDSGGHLSQDEEHRLFDHYGIAWDASWREANRPGPGGWARGESRPGAGRGDGTGAGPGTAAGAGPAAGAMGAGTAEAPAGTGRHRKPAQQDADRANPRGRQTTPGAEDMRGRDEARGRGGTGGGEESRRLMRGENSGQAEKAAHAGDDYMTRSEEHLHVRAERQETGHARLRKYVVTEEEQQTIPLRKEQVSLEREPITEANRGAALSGPEIAESEYEVTLHEERPMVEKRAEPVERVRLRVEERTENETVRGQVRKERIDAESDTPDGIPEGRGERRRR
ncbi:MULTISPECIES: PRC and DUF2382 domain-containing protein [Streptomyces]|uniref:PRC and DUF2382 domain-containing protein n=1 Tax=Streptomyces TaxID=1883 RepID=UPI00224941B6|nr:PRC and DUF2382 domain-containing protein [Streptomyces sp. JHD 1]MCX2970635.1 PRC and DUF2382 domain-containing protein [Streptomyces sp. JHD 1]